MGSAVSLKWTAWSATRKAIVLGQAGDRLDDEIEEQDHQVESSRSIFLKEVPGHAYGRERRSR